MLKTHKINFQKLFNGEFSNVVITGQFSPVAGESYQERLLQHIGADEKTRKIMSDCQWGSRNNIGNKTKTAKLQDKILHHYVSDDNIDVYFVGNPDCECIEVLFGDSDENSPSCYGGVSWSFGELGVWINDDFVDDGGDQPDNLYVMGMVVKKILKACFDDNNIFSITAKY